MSCFSTILINTYCSPAGLFVDGDVLYSTEGTTQGDPLAMPFYALALIRKLNQSVVQAWYADDACACGALYDLHLWWDQVSQFGPLLAISLMLRKPGLLLRGSFWNMHVIFSQTPV